MFPSWSVVVKKPASGHFIMNENGSRSTSASFEQSGAGKEVRSKYRTVSSVVEVAVVVVSNNRCDDCDDGGSGQTGRWIIMTGAAAC